MLRWISISTLLAASIIWAPSVFALPEPVQLAMAQESQEEPEREPGPADLEEAVKIAEKHSGGNVANADTVVREGRRVHEVRVLLKDGSVRTVRVDPNTGAIIPQEQPQR